MSDHHHHHDQRRGDVAACVGVEPEPDQPRTEGVGEHRFADDPVENADGGDADLDRGQETGRMLTELHRYGRGTVAVCRQLGEA